MEGTARFQLKAVRKGTWTEEEDELLRKCVDKYGQGEWHRVPFRAGLNRCRKSCRLRWFNYLSPNIKRGKFTEDEIDMIVRLHKLLGNRWTLIAGRLSGRTANDVKNYWNTHMISKTRVSNEETRKRKTKSPETNVIKPRPRTISKDFNKLHEVGTSAPNNPIAQDNLDEQFQLVMPLEDDNAWWESMISGEARVIAEGRGVAVGEPLLTSPWSNVEGDKVWEDELSFDINVWSALSADQEELVII